MKGASPGVPGSGERGPPAGGFGSKEARLKTSARPVRGAAAVIRGGRCCALQCAVKASKRTRASKKASSGRSIRLASSRVVRSWGSKPCTKVGGAGSFPGARHGVGSGLRNDRVPPALEERGYALSCCIRCTPGICIASTPRRNCPNARKVNKTLSLGRSAPANANSSPGGRACAGHPEA